MCKAVKYWFACNHGFRLRHSGCGGTKHRLTKNGPAPACKSEPYLEYIFTINCGPCQFQAFEHDWQRRLRLANTFLSRLKETCFPGIQEVGALVTQLEEEFSTAMWNTRTLFPHVHKERAVRVSLGHWEKAPSPLSRNVSPGDIPDPPEVVGSDYSKYESDGDYVASTDPFLPVDTNYVHPLDGVDISWLSNYFSPEELEQSGEGTCFNADEVNTVWTSGQKELYPDSSDWPDNTMESTTEATGLQTLHSSGIDIYQAAGDSTSSASMGSQVKTCADDKSLLIERIDMAVDEFWRLVNSQELYEPSSPDIIFALHGNMDSNLNNLHISNSSRDPKTPRIGLLTPPQTPPRHPTDGSFDFDIRHLHESDAPISSDIESQPPTSVSQFPSTPTPNWTNSYYAKWRRDLYSTKDANRVKFSKELLYLSRCEIREVEGPNGRFVLDPQLSQDGDVEKG